MGAFHNKQLPGKAKASDRKKTGPPLHTIIARNRAHLNKETISRLETASHYQYSVRGRCYRLTEICDDPPKLGAGFNPSILEFWKKEWEKQKSRAGEYNDAVAKFMLLEMEENHDSKTRSQEWKEQFDVVADKMETWAAKMREILSKEDLRKLVAEKDQVEAGEGAKTV